MSESILDQLLQGNDEFYPTYISTKPNPRPRIPRINRQDFNVPTVPLTLPTSPLPRPNNHMINISNSKMNSPNIDTIDNVDSINMNASCSHRIQECRQDLEHERAIIANLNNRLEQERESLNEQSRYHVEFLKEKNDELQARNHEIEQLKQIIQLRNLSFERQKDELARIQEFVLRNYGEQSALAMNLGNIPNLIPTPNSNRLFGTRRRS